LPLTLPNIHRFSKFFHRQAQQLISGKEITKRSITLPARCYTTLRYVCAQKSSCPRAEWS